MEAAGDRSVAGWDDDGAGAEFADACGAGGLADDFAAEPAEVRCGAGCAADRSGVELVADAAGVEFNAALLPASCDSSGAFGSGDFAVAVGADERGALAASSRG